MSVYEGLLQSGSWSILEGRLFNPPKGSFVSMKRVANRKGEVIKINLMK
jgi:hypothetical protein